MRHSMPKDTCVSDYSKIIHLLLLNKWRILDFFLIINSLTEEENLAPQQSVVPYREAEI